MNMSHEVRYVQTPGVQLRAVEDDTFLIDPEVGTIHHLNQLGAAIWRQLDDPITLGALIDLLSAAFPEVPPSRITADVEALLTKLEAQSLVISDPEDC